MGGRLVLPVGPTPHAQKLIRAVRESEETFRRQEITEVRFVPLVGASGWGEEEGSDPSSP